MEGHKRKERTKGKDEQKGQGVKVIISQKEKGWKTKGCRVRKDKKDRTVKKKKGKWRKKIKREKGWEKIWQFYRLKFPPWTFPAVVAYFLWLVRRTGSPERSRNFVSFGQKRSRKFARKKGKVRVEILLVEWTAPKVGKRKEKSMNLWHFQKKVCEGFGCGWINRKLCCCQL